MAHKQSAFLVFGPSADRQGQTPGFIRVSSPNHFLVIEIAVNMVCIHIVKLDR